MQERSLPVPVELVARRIYLIRAQRVMIDSDLAALYGVPTKALNQAVKRNAGRFPGDFMFQLTKDETDALRSQLVTLDLRLQNETSNWRSQIVTSNSDAKMGLRRPPYAFTELGVAMLSSVLNSERAVQMNITIMRAFVKLREIVATNKALAQRIDQIASTVKDHSALFDIVIQDIEKLDQKFTKEMRRLKAPRRRNPRFGFV
jgi:hypothetical protein